MRSYVRGMLPNRIAAKTALIWMQRTQRPHTHTRAVELNRALRSEQTVEVFRSEEQATLKERVTFTSSEEREGGVELWWEHQREMTFLILQVWTYRDFDRERELKHGGGILEGCPDMLTRARGVEKHPWGAIWSLFRPQSLLNHLTSCVSHLLYLSFSIFPHPGAQQYINMHAYTHLKCLAPSSLCELKRSVNQRFLGTSLDFSLALLV